MTAKCNIYSEETIFAYIEDALEISKKEEFKKHIGNCTTCKEEYTKSKEVLDALKSIKSNTRKITQNCFDIDIARYAFNEMSGDEEEKARNHIITCNHCLGEVIAMRASDTAVSDEKECSVVSNSKNFFYALYEYVKTALSINVHLELIPSSGTTSATKTREVVSTYNIKLPLKEGKILLFEDESCPDILKPVKGAIDGELFYYTCFLILDDKKIEELPSAVQKKEQWLPIEIALPNNNLQYLAVLLSQKRDTLKKINKDLFMNALNSKAKEPIEDVICVFVEVEK